MIYKNKHNNPMCKQIHGWAQKELLDNLKSMQFGNSLTRYNILTAIFFNIL